MELFEDLFRVWWRWFLALSTFSKIFYLSLLALVATGIIHKTLEEQKIREAKLKSIKRREKKQDGKEDKEKIDDFLLKS